MAELPISQQGTVRLRGIAFPIDCIRAAMLETGGIVVSDENINRELDRAVTMHRMRTGKEPEMFLVEAIPATWFIPKKITVHRATHDIVGTKTDACLYFAVSKKF